MLKVLKQVRLLPIHSTQEQRLTSWVVANAAKSTVSGSSKTAEGIVDKAKVQVKQNSSDSTTQLGGAADSIKGSAKKLQGQAQSKAEEVKQKL